MMDNTQVVSAINVGKSDNRRSMDLIRLIFWETVKYNCHLVGVFLPGVKNVLADAISRAKDFDAIPDILCCRGKCVCAGIGFMSRRAKVDGLVDINVENKDITVEALSQLL